MPKSKKNKKQEIIDKINPLEALRILEILCRKNAEILKRTEELFLNRIREVDVEEIAEEVFSDIDFIDVEDLWDKSGSSRYGYTDPADAAWEMVEEVIEPHLKKMKRLRSLGMFHEEMRYCMGVISGLYQFESESSTEFKDWAVDIPGELADTILSEWKDSHKDSELLAAMESFTDSC